MLLFFVLQLDSGLPENCNMLYTLIQIPVKLWRLIFVTVDKLSMSLI